MAKKCTKTLAACAELLFCLCRVFLTIPNVVIVSPFAFFPCASLGVCVCISHGFILRP